MPFKLSKAGILMVCRCHVQPPMAGERGKRHAQSYDGFDSGPSAVSHEVNIPMTEFVLNVILKCMVCTRFSCICPDCTSRIRYFKAE